MRQDIAAVVLLAFGAGLFLALTTYTSLDGPLIARGLSPANLMGRIGHWVAGGFLGVLGFSAAVLPVGISVGSWKLFKDEPLRVTLLSAAAYAALTISLATLCHIVLAGHVEASFPAGGAIGAALGAGAERLLGFWGSVLALTAATTVALIVATDLKVQRVASGFAWSARAAGGFAHAQLRGAVDEHRIAIAELRAEEAAERVRQAEELASTAVVDGQSEEDLDEARAVAGALALEHVRRTFDEPAWVGALAPIADDTVDEPEIALEAPSRRRKPKGEAADAAVGAAAGQAEPILPPTIVPPPSLAKPEIVVSQAMQERGKKKKDKKEVPSFAFTKAGEVFRLPSIDLLDVHEEKARALDEGGLTRTAEQIVATLRQHGVDGRIGHIRPGPVVTLYEFSPVAGVKLARIENLDKELTMALSTTRIRIIAPIPGKGVVGIEVPNKDRGTVFLRDILESEGFANASGFLPLGLGKDIEGVPYCVDLQKMPHLLIAGTTGAGKSVGLNTMILSMLYRQTPAEVRMIMVDPKMTELSPYENIPHLLLPVVTDPQKAARALQWAVDEMERRTQILADTGSKDLKSYNQKAERLRAAGRTFEDRDDLLPPPKKLVIVDVAAGESEEEAVARAAAEPAAQADAAVMSPEFEDPTAPPPADPVAARDEKRLPQKLPYIVVVIDELADLMITAPREVETSLARLAAKARATGIHLIVATQRPSTDVVTGTIKNNFPARISFRLGSRHDSQTIINGPGAEALLGNGDMLVMTATQALTRVQGAFVSEEELHRVVGFLKEQGRPVYDESILKARDQGDGGRYDDEEDPVYDQAIELVARMDEVSVSKLQREMRLGYNKAAKIIERMEREGLVGPANGVKPRQVLMRGATPGEATPMPNF
jgi:S-DNA-T family DNA segregation ATPase FtsK/SpoIIIE